MIICEKCGSELYDDSKFCFFCGNKIVHKSAQENLLTNCPNCNSKIESEEKFCIKCGFNLVNQNSSSKLNSDNSQSQSDSIIENIKNSSNEFLENNLSQKNVDSIKNSYDDLGRATEKFINDGTKMIDSISNFGKTDIKQNNVYRNEPNNNMQFDKAYEIKKYYDLYKDGILTEEEFNKIKRDLIMK